MSFPVSPHVRHNQMQNLSQQQNRVGLPSAGPHLKTNAAQVMEAQAQQKAAMKKREEKEKQKEKELLEKF